MLEFEKLSQQRTALLALIGQMQHVHTQFINVLLEVRKEISELSTLQMQYPHSQSIPEQLRSCDAAISTVNEKLADIQDTIAKHKETITEIDARLHPEISTSQKFKP